MVRNRHQLGLTLVESLIASAVLAVAASAVYLSISAAQMQMHYAAHARRGVTLAEEMLQYVTAMPYSDPQGSPDAGPDAGEASIADYDNMDDFHGYTENAGELTDVAGNGYPATHQLFSRSVSAEYVTPNVAALGGAIPGLQVTVTVQSPKGEIWSVTRFVAEPVN